MRHVQLLSSYFSHLTIMNFIDSENRDHALSARVQDDWLLCICPVSNSAILKSAIITGISVVFELYQYKDNYTCYFTWESVRRVSDILHGHQQLNSSSQRTHSEEVTATCLLPKIRHISNMAISGIQHYR